MPVDLISEEQELRGGVKLNPRLIFSNDDRPAPSSFPFSPAYLKSVYKPTVSKKVVIPAKAGIQCFQGSLDAGSSPA
jgi:hypothetical protein